MVIRLAGRHDASNMPYPDLTGVRHLTVDLREATFLDAAAFSELVRWLGIIWSWNGRVVLMGPQGPVLEMLRDSGLDQVVEFQTT